MNAIPPDSTKPKPSKDTSWLTLVEQKVRAVSYGSILIVVHDGKVVQVEATEKLRVNGRDLLRSEGEPESQ
jgi:hypothetical protein